MELFFLLIILGFASFIFIIYKCFTSDWYKASVFFEQHPEEMFDEDDDDPNFYARQMEDEMIIAQDEYLPALKAIYKYSKSNDFYKIKGGVLDGKESSVEELTTLAQLPSREELIAKLAGCLLANVSKLAATLDAVRVKKEEEAK